MVYKRKFEMAFGKTFPAFLGDAFFQALSTENPNRFVNRGFHEARRITDQTDVVSCLARARVFAPPGWRPVAEWVLIVLWAPLLILLCLALSGRSLW